MSQAAWQVMRIFKIPDVDLLEQMYEFEHIELPAKLLDYVLRSNKSNINQGATVRLGCIW